MPKSVADTTTLRWTVRTDGKSGYIFINNYERGQEMPARSEQLALKLSSETLKIPTAAPAPIPANAFLIWPFNLDLNGSLLKYATAQLICRVDDGPAPVFVFFTPGETKSEFALANNTTASVNGNAPDGADGLTLVSPQPGIGAESVVSVQSKDGRQAKILLLSQAHAMHLWKANLWGAPRLVMSPADLAFDGDSIFVTTRDPRDMSISVYPAPSKSLTADAKSLPSSPDGIFTKYAASMPAKQIALKLTKVKDAGPARAIVFGAARRPPVPTEPNDADFDAAGVWQIGFPADAMNGVHEVFVKIDYAGDAARAYIGDQFIDDDFYFGQPWEIGMKRFSPTISEKGLMVKVLPLRKDSPIYIEPERIPQFGPSGEALEMRSVTAEPEYQLTIRAEH
jgi:hypothetical protein